MASVPQWKLRRLAPRAVRVVERRSQKHPTIAAYATTVIPAAQAFMNAYDAAARAGIQQRRELGEGKDAVTALEQTMRGWLPLVARDVGGFDTSMYLDSPVPDDVIEDAERLLDVVERVELTYREAAAKALNEALEAAQREWAEAEDANVALQESQASARDAARVFERELQALRRTLGVVLGRSDRDFQKLRSARAAAPDDDDDANAPPAVSPAKPAAATAQPPTG